MFAIGNFVVEITDVYGRVSFAKSTVRWPSSWPQYSAAKSPTTFQCNNRRNFKLVHQSQVGYSNWS